MATRNVAGFADREGPRHPTPPDGDQAIQACLDIESTEIHGVLIDISRNGACVRVPEEVVLLALPRTILTLRATLGTETVSMTADLRWVHAGPSHTLIGMGFPYGPMEKGTFLDPYFENEGAAD